MTPTTGTSGGLPGGPTALAQAMRGPGCPRCAERELWIGWATPASSCPRCGLDLGRHGWTAALWINTWITIVAIAAWIVSGMVLTEARGAWWVTGGAVVIAVVVPPVTYRYAKAVMLRLLHRFDPPEGGAL